MPLKFAEFWLAVEAPVSVTVTCAAEVAAASVVAVCGGTYCTITVQLLPGFTTAPDTQVPPVTEKVPDPEVAVVVGLPVSVSGPALEVAVLLTVIVPVLVDLILARVVDVVVRTGEGAEMATVAPRTVNVAAGVVPVGVVTVMLCAPSPVEVRRFSVAVTVVAFTATKLETAIPEAVTAVAPVSPVPVIVIGTLVPRTPEAGLMEVMVGPRTVKVSALLVRPLDVTVTLRAPVVAVEDMVNTAVTVVGLVTVTPLTVMPAPDTLTAVVPDSPVPVRVTFTVVPRRPEFGEIEVSTGVVVATEP